MKVLPLPRLNNWCQAKRKYGLWQLGHYRFSRAGGPIWVKSWCCTSPNRKSCSMYLAALKLYWLKWECSWKWVERHKWCYSPQFRASKSSFKSSVSRKTLLEACMVKGAGNAYINAMKNVWAELTPGITTINPLVVSIIPELKEWKKSLSWSKITTARPSKSCIHCVSENSKITMMSKMHCWVFKSLEVQIGKKPYSAFRSHLPWRVGRTEFKNCLRSGNLIYLWGCRPSKLQLLWRPGLH